MGVLPYVCLPVGQPLVEEVVSETGLYYPFPSRSQSSTPTPGEIGRLGGRAPGWGRGRQVPGGSGLSVCLDAS